MSTRPSKDVLSIVIRIYGKPFAALLLWRRYKTKTYVTDVAMLREKMFFLLSMLWVIVKMEDLESAKAARVSLGDASRAFRFEP